MLLEELDSIDRDILSELDQNARQSVAEIAGRLGLGRERVSYRMRKLEDRGVLRRYTASLNPYKFGLVVHKTFIQLENNKSRVKKFLEYLERHQRVYWYAECAGSWDLMFATFGENPKDFHQTHGKILSKFSDIIISFSVYTIVEAMFFRRSYLRGVGTDFFTFGGTPDTLELSLFDYELLRLLTENCRLTSSELADTLNVSPAVVRYHIKRLEDDQVISGYRIDLDLPLLGINHFKAQLHLRNYDIKAEEDLREYCKMNPHVILLVQQIGDCMVEVEFETYTYQQYNEFIEEMREHFSKYIRRVDSIVIRKEKYKWMAFEAIRSH